MKFNKLQKFYFCLGALFLIWLNSTGAQQIPIDRVEKMPNQPAPYFMRDWKQVTLGYDSLVFNFNLTGPYLPLIRWNDQTVNYPERSFGLHTVVGTSAPRSAEAINVLPAVIGASLVGIDKSQQHGTNWVQMCQEYFNNRPEEMVYLNHPDASTGDDWWYETMPNVFFYQLSSLYPGVGHFDEQFTAVADRWLAAVQKMGGATTPWMRPYLNYRAWSLSDMKPLTTGVTEPEAAGAIAWLLYHAFTQTGDEKYRIGAEWCLEFLDNWSTNPSYELQLPYGVYTAARMNAEIGTQYNLTKFLNWCFDLGSLRDWGVIVGNWGGYDCSGLVGEAQGSGYYAFIMNGFEQVGALVPLVRYDDRFARAIGKWVLNVANASRLFYPNFLPDSNQDSEDWAHAHDPHSWIAHEALRRTWENASPFATGDAIRGGWGATNLALYGSSHVGIFGGIIDTTNVPMILKLDLLKTDFFHAAAYPSFLFFNPFPEDKQVAWNVGDNPVDIYDAAANQFLLTGVRGMLELHLPGDAAVLAVLVPAGGAMTYELNKMQVNGVTVDFQAGQLVNYPPRIKSLAPVRGKILTGQSTNIYCTAVDRENSALTFQWRASGGTISGSSSNVNWTAPDIPGNYFIFCIVTDASGAIDSASTRVEVVELLNQPPRINKINAVPRKLDLGATTELSCEAKDPDENAITFNWTTREGALQSDNATASWTAPATEGYFWIGCTVTDEHGAATADSIQLLVRDFSQNQSGQIVAHYPFHGDARDAAGNHHGTVSGAILIADRLVRANEAYRFDGVNDFIRVPNHAELNFQSAISLNFWLKITQFFDREAHPISHGSWENRWKISLTRDGLRWTLKTDAVANNGIKDLDSETALELNRFYNVTVTFDGRDCEIWLDGQLDAFAPWSGRLRQTTIDLMIGQVLPTNANYNFSGVLDDIRIYDYALSFDEINLLAHNTNRVTPATQNPLPQFHFLAQNFPNPFNAATTISYGLAHAGQVKILIYDILGQQLRTLVNQHQPAGNYRASWNGKNEQGEWVASGIYVCTLQTGNFSAQRKLLFLK